MAVTNVAVTWEFFAKMFNNIASLYFVEYGCL